MHTASLEHHCKDSDLLLIEDLEMTLLRNTRQEETELVHAPQKRFVLWRGMKWKESKKQLPTHTATEPRE